jgi:CTP synthase (UTP-ammonia lyase)
LCFLLAHSAPGINNPQQVIRVILIGDYSKEVLAHDAIPNALALATDKLSVEVAHEWLGTTQIASSESISTKRPDAVWCVPGSPYRNMQGALTAIRYARENKIPFLGTCGGFQHALIEYARNALNIVDADHTESNPGTETPLIAKLSCALVNKSETIRIYPQTRLAEIYNSLKADEPYQCSYGFNPAFRKHFESAPMKFSTPLHFTAFNDDLGVRAFELTDHPFFIGTLFQPERSALTGRTHSLICAFVKAASVHSKFAAASEK